MSMELASREGRYFWSDWFDGHSLALLSTTFALLSLADLVATLRMMLLGVVKEGNALADAVWIGHGPIGFIVYKTVLVTLIITLIWLVDQRNPRLARSVIGGAVVLMGAIALRHLAIMAALAL